MKAEKKSFVKHENIFLPKWLFVEKSKKSKNVSPAARFDPVAASDNSQNAFQSSSSPSDKPDLKIIAINPDSMDQNLQYGVKIAILRKLQLLGFKIYFKRNDEFELLKEDLSNLKKSDLEANKTLDENNDLESDFEKLSDLGIARDRVVILDQDKSREINSAFSENVFGKDYDISHSCTGNTLQYFTSEPLHEHKNKGTIDYLILIAKSRGIDNLKSIFNDKVQKVADYPSINGDALAKVIKEFPENAKEFIEDYYPLIENELQLASCIKAAPQFVGLLCEKMGENFFSNFQNIIKIAHLVNTLKEAGQTDVAEYLFHHYKHKITNNDFLAIFISEFPEKADSLLEEFKDNLNKSEIYNLIDDLINLNRADLAFKVINESEEISEQDLEEILSNGKFKILIEYLDSLPDKELLISFIEKFQTEINNKEISEYSRCYPKYFQSLSDLDGEILQKISIEEKIKNYAIINPLDLLTNFKCLSKVGKIEKAKQQLINYIGLHFKNSDEHEEQDEKYFTDYESLAKCFEFYPEALSQMPIKNNIYHTLGVLRALNENNNLSIANDFLEKNILTMLQSFINDETAANRFLRTFVDCLLQTTKSNTIGLILGVYTDTYVKNKEAKLSDLFYSIIKTKNPGDSHAPISKILKTNSPVNAQDLFLSVEYLRESGDKELNILADEMIEKYIYEIKDFRKFHSFIENISEQEAKKFSKAIFECAVEIFSSLENRKLDISKSVENQLKKKLSAEQFSSLINLTKGDFQKTEYGNDNSIPKDITYLQIGKLNKEELNFLQKQFESGLFDQIVSLRVNIVENEELLSNLFKIINSRQQINIKCLVAPKKFKNLVNDSIKKGDLPENISLYFFRGYGRTILESKNIFNQQNKKKPNGIYIVEENSDKEKKFGIAQNPNPVYSLEMAGEVLNSKENSLRTRTKITTREILKTLDQKTYNPKEFKAIDQQEIIDVTEYDVEKFKNANDGVYCKFVCELPANKRVRLLSINSEDQLIGIAKQIDDSKLKIEKGDDDFYYITSNKKQKISYFIKSPNKIKTYRDLPDNDPVKNTINEYKNSDKFEPSQDPAKKNLPLILKNKFKRNYPGFMESLYQERAGSCRHRVAAVEYNLIKNGVVSKNDLRCVTVDGSHEILEYRYRGSWYKIDLGGGSAQENYLNDKYEDHQQAEKKKSKLNKPFSSRRFSFGNGTEKYSRKSIDAKTKEKISLANFSATPQKIGNESDLSAKIFKENNGKTLLVTTQIKSHSFALMEMAKNQGRKVFYVESPSQVAFGKDNILIADQDKVSISSQVEFEKFLSEIQKNSDPENPPLIIINWDSFSSKERVALNTVLDNQSTINGREIPNHVQIVSLCEKDPDDLSFLSRHQSYLTSNINFDQKYYANDNKKAGKIIDLEGFPNWRQELFGKVSLVGDKMVWTQSQFVKDLIAGEDNFEIINISPSDAKILNDEIAKSKANGKIIYHGFEIEIPKNLQIKCQEKDFDFSKFAAVKVASCDISKAPPEAHLINTYIFDILLHDKIIKDGLYQEEAGLLEKYSGKELSLFITSELSDNQYYSLLQIAKEKNVELKLFLAPNIKLPEKIKFQRIKPETSNLKEIKTPNIYVSNDTEETSSEIIAEEKNIYAVIDVEDFSYQDLIKTILFNKTQDGFKDFEEEESKLISKLRNGKKIILKGSFSPDLLQMLQPLIIDGTFENLILIIEDKTANNQKDYEPLSFLPKELIKIKHHQANQKPNSKIFEEEEASKKITEKSQHTAKEFIKQRQDLLLGRLAQGQIVEMVGASGVGKSQLIKTLELQEDTRVSREMESFESWALDTENKTKILFIDESNIDDRHYTLFSALKKPFAIGETRRIFYQGKFYKLDENHKVVFARNPHSFGGGRNEQKLFADGDIPQIILKDFPADYIYEKILKETIYDKLPEDQKELISEKEFKNRCQELLDNYYKANDLYKSDPKNNPEFTVRELQEQVLQFLLNNIQENQEAEELKTANFISTDATKESEEALDRCFRIRQLQKSGSFSMATGINGVLMEGKPGIGKSQMIEAFLDKKGIKIVNNDDEVSPDEKTKCYKIDAALPLEEKIRIITKAFEEGNIVWIDEINSVIDDGLEKVLNAVLTGQHPTTKGVEIKPGFMLIGTMNPISMKGRSPISPALQHRLYNPPMKSLVEYSHKDIEKIVNHWIEQKEGLNLSQKHQSEIVEEIFKITQTDKKANLRTLRKQLDSYLEEFRKNPNIYQEDSAKKPTQQEIQEDKQIQSIQKIENDNSKEDELARLINILINKNKIKPDEYGYVYISTKTTIRNSKDVVVKITEGKFESLHSKGYKGIPADISKEYNRELYDKALNAAIKSLEQKTSRKVKIRSVVQMIKIKRTR